MISSLIKMIIVGVVIIGLAFIGKAEIARYWDDKLSSDAINLKVPDGIIAKIKAPSVSTNGSTVTNVCADNTLSQLVLVSISERTLWACQETTLEYSSPVITGMSFLAADLTPTGTYHIYAKETDTHLIGHDSTGSWNDFVYYWMPFLDNKYGEYGFHDATWRPANAFGNVSPDSSNASHGCVECPLATAAWLYNWTVIGTTVTIED
jgi:lipoprotein-anchoring transpeptidase ErfK/SrfK